MTELSGLTEAIEAVIAHGHKIHERADGWLCSCGEAGTDRPVPGSKAHRHLIAVDLAVAAPILVTAALRQAADRIVANADGHPDRGRHGHRRGRAPPHRRLTSRRDHTMTIERNLGVAHSDIATLDEGLAWIVQTLDKDFADAKMIKISLEQISRSYGDEPAGVWHYVWTAAVHGMVEEIETPQIGREGTTP